MLKCRGSWLRLALSVVILLQLQTALCEARPVDATAELRSRCEGLPSVDFSDIPDAPVQVISAAWIGEPGAGPHCLITGYASSGIGFKLGLPEAWNGKLLQSGCGGHCGMLMDDAQFPLVCWDAFRRGYACINSDAGHRGSGTDGLWAYGNLAAKVDWGFRAQHVTALAGKALAERYFRRRPVRSYFIGSSTGGRQALQEAQRFPSDFDGIVAIAPPVDLATIYVTFAWGMRALHDEAGAPLLGRRDLELLTEAALAKCDLKDGVKDRVIVDPLDCGFDPAALTCKARQSADNCLSSAQVEAARKVYAGPMTSSGQPLSLGGPVAGSEIGRWSADPRDGWGTSYLGLSFDSRSYKSLITAGLRFLFFWPENGPAWKLSDFDFDRDPRRMSVMQTLYDSSNPDLRKFKAAGGKLLIFHGLNDSSVSPRQTIDYYETVERTMGGRDQTKDFCRLFLLPGVGHSGGGEGAGVVDYLSAIEAWAEQGKAPDRLIAMKLKDDDWRQPSAFPLDPGRIQFTRPLYPYPTRAKYSGRGDPNDAGNFGPISSQLSSDIRDRPTPLGE